MVQPIGHGGEAGRWTLKSVKPHLNWPAVLQAVVAICLALLGAEPAYARSIVVEYYGDSTVWGYASGSEGGQVARPAPLVFAESLVPVYRVKVRNHGVSGSTACSLLHGTDGRHPHWEAQMKLSQAHFVILNHAINDQWQYGLGTYKTCLRQLARIAQGQGKRVIFETPNPTRDSGAGGLDAYVAAMKDVARSEGVPVIDQYAYLGRLMQGQSLQAYVPDGLHPADHVYELKGRFAAQAFARLLRRGQ